MAGCGRAARLRRGWLANSAWYRSRHSVAGKRSRRLAGRSRSHVRRTRNQPRRKKRPHLKKALGCHCRGGGDASPPRFLRHVRSSPICSEETLCLLKTPKGQESLEMFAPPPYRREHDHNSFYPAVNNRATKQRVTFSHQFCSIASPIRISSDQLRARRG